LSDSAFATYWVNRLPRFVRQMIATIIEFKLGPIKLPVYHSPLFAKMLRGTQMEAALIPICEPYIDTLIFSAGRKSRKSYGLWERILERKLVMDQIRDQMVSNNIDVILAPVFPFPAPYYQIPGKISRT